MSASQYQISVADGQSGAIITNVRVKADADELGVTITNPDAVLPQIMETVEAEATNLTKTMTLDERATKVMTAITERLRADGFVVQEMAVGDLTLNFEVSLESGMLIGRAQGMLPDGSANLTQLPRDVHLAIARGFAKGGQDLADELEALVAVRDHDGAAAAVADGLANGVFAARNPKLWTRSGPSP